MCRYWESVFAVDVNHNHSRRGKAFIQRASLSTSIILCVRRNEFPCWFKTIFTNSRTGETFVSSVHYIMHTREQCSLFSQYKVLRRFKYNIKVHIFMGEKKNSQYTKPYYYSICSEHKFLFQIKRSDVLF
jgi:hypothetical protein